MQLRLFTFFLLHTAANKIAHSKETIPTLPITMANTSAGELALETDGRTGITSGAFNSSSGVGHSVGDGSIITRY
jgi:hypothetical protein